jgi:hypothetical protein
MNNAGQSADCPALRFYKELCFTLAIRENLRIFPNCLFHGGIAAENSISNKSAIF